MSRVVEAYAALVYGVQFFSACRLLTRVMVDNHYAGLAWEKLPTDILLLGSPISP